MGEYGERLCAHGRVFTNICECMAGVYIYMFVHSDKCDVHTGWDIFDVHACMLEYMCSEYMYVRACRC